MGYKSSIQFYIDVPLPYIRFSVYIKIQFCEYFIEPSFRSTVIYTFLGNISDNLEDVQDKHFVE